MSFYNCLEVISLVNLKIRDLREDNDWTQQHVADLLFISRTTYAAYENSVNQPPFDMLIKIANIHNTSVDFLLGLTNVKEPYPRKK